MIKIDDGENVIVSTNGIILKKFSLYDDYAHREAQKYIDKLNRNSEYLESEIERAKKEQ